MRSFTPPFQQQCRKAVHYGILCSLCLVGPVIHSSWYDFSIRLTRYTCKQQFVPGFPPGCSGDKDRMDDDFKPASMIANLCYVTDLKGEKW